MTASPPGLRITHPRTGLVRVSGEADFSNAHDLVAIRETLTTADLVMDLSELTFIDVTCVLALEDVAQRVPGTLTFVHACRAVRLVLELARFRDRVPDSRIFPDAGPKEGRGYAGRGVTAAGLVPDPATAWHTATGGYWNRRISRSRTSRWPAFHSIRSTLQ